MKKLISTFLVLVMVVTSITVIGATSAAAAANASCTNYKVSSITYNSAKLSCTINNPKATKTTEAGYNIGLSKSSMKYADSWNTNDKRINPYQYKKSFNINLVLKN